VLLHDRHFIRLLLARGFCETLRCSQPAAVDKIASLRYGGGGGVGIG
jgi:hypothetical protein